MSEEKNHKKFNLSVAFMDVNYITW